MPLLAALLLALVAVVASPVSASEPEAPGKVQNLSWESNSHGEIDISWDAPEDSDVTRYIIHLKPDGGKKGSGNTKRPKAKKTSITFTNLAPGEYNAFIRAKNDTGKGERTEFVIKVPDSGSCEGGEGGSWVWSSWFCLRPFTSGEWCVKDYEWGDITWEELRDCLEKHDELELLPPNPAESTD